MIRLNQQLNRVISLLLVLIWGATCNSQIIKDAESFESKAERVGVQWRLNSKTGPCNGELTVVTFAAPAIGKERQITRTEPLINPVDLP